MVILGKYTRLSIVAQKMLIRRISSCVGLSFTCSANVDYFCPHNRQTLSHPSRSEQAHFQPHYTAFPLITQCYVRFRCRTNSQANLQTSQIRQQYIKLKANSFRM